MLEAQEALLLHAQGLESFGFRVERSGFRVYGLVQPTCFHPTDPGTHAP